MRSVDGDVRALQDLLARSLHLVTREAVELDDDSRRAFALALDTTEPGAAIAYTLPYPKHAFLQWCLQERALLAHGSPNCAIAEFIPTWGRDWDLRRRKAVYASDDDIFPIFYAVLDRRRYLGTIRVGSARFVEGPLAGARRYWFSVNPLAYRRQCWTSGAVYLFDRTRFVQQEPRGGMEPAEWWTEHPVRARASLAVEPTDFPLMGAVRIHREWRGFRVALRLWRLERRLLRRAGIRRP